MGKFPMKHRDDLTQECHLVLLESIESIKEARNQKSYIFSVLLNHCARWYETHVKPQEISLDNFTRDEDGEKARFSDLVECRMNLNSFLDAKDSLEVLEQNMPYPDYKVLELYHSGYSPKDIIEQFPELGLKSTGAVYSILRWVA